MNAVVEWCVLEFTNGVYMSWWVSLSRQAAAVFCGEGEGRGIFVGKCEEAVVFWYLCVSCIVVLFVSPGVGSVWSVSMLASVGNSVLWELCV